MKFKGIVVGLGLASFVFLAFMFELESVIEAIKNYTQWNYVLSASISVLILIPSQIYALICVCRRDKNDAES